MGVNQKRQLVIWGISGWMLTNLVTVFVTPLVSFPDVVIEEEMGRIFETFFRNSPTHKAIYQELLWLFQKKYRSSSLSSTAKTVISLVHALVTSQTMISVFVYKRGKIRKYLETLKIRATFFQLIRVERLKPRNLISTSMSSYSINKQKDVHFVEKPQRTWPYG